MTTTRVDTALRLDGEGVSGGRAAGPIYVVEDLPERPEEGRLDKADAARAALDSVAARLEALAAMRRRTSITGAQLLEGQALIARDPLLRQEVLDAIAGGAGVSEAVTLATERHASALEALADEYLRERATDVREVARLARGALRGGGESRLASLTRPAVVVAHELTAADLLAVDRSLLLALVTETGGRQSHAAIVAREFGIPAVVQAAGAVGAARQVPAGRVDGDRGTIELLAEVPVAAARTASRQVIPEVSFAQLILRLVHRHNQRPPSSMSEAGPRMPDVGNFIATRSRAASDLSDVPRSEGLSALWPPPAGCKALITIAGREDMRLENIYRPLLIDADPTETLSDVATRMRENDVSSLAVIDNGEVVGIITERDVVTAVADKAAPDTAIAAYVTANPATADPDESATAVVARTLDLGVRHLPVVRSGAVVGMVSARDLMALEVRPSASGAD